MSNIRAMSKSSSDACSSNCFVLAFCLLIRLVNFGQKPDITYWVKGTEETWPFL